MIWLQNMYTFFQTFFEFLSFRTKPQNDLIEDIENRTEYEFIMLNEKNQMLR